MDLFKLFTLFAAGFAGATMGSFLLVTLLYSALLKHPSNLTDSLYIYRRLYRLNSVLCLLGGICAALVNDRTATFMLAILAVSYIFSLAHILKAISKTCNTQLEVTNISTYRSLSNIQNLIHFFQFTGAGYAIYLLAITA